jgi:hypothetical protein
MNERTDGLRGSRKKRVDAMTSAGAWELPDLINAMRGLLDHTADVRASTIDALARMSTVRPLTVAPIDLVEPFLGGTLVECARHAQSLAENRSPQVDQILVRWLRRPGRQVEVSYLANFLAHAGAAALIETALDDAALPKKRQALLLKALYLLATFEEPRWDAP